MNNVRFRVMVRSFCLMLSFCAPAALPGPKPVSTTAQEPPSADIPMTLEPVVVTGRADDLTGIASLLLKVGSARHNSKPGRFSAREKSWKSCLA